MGNFGARVDNLSMFLSFNINPVICEIIADYQSSGIKKKKMAFHAETRERLANILETIATLSIKPSQTIL